MSLEKTVRKHVLKNAYDYGKAQPGGIVGKVIAEFPDAKKDMKATMSVIAKACAEVNNMAKPEIEKEMQAFTYLEKAPEEEKKILLPDAVEGKTVTRFPPEPNGYSHIGHAKAAFLNLEGAKNAGGKCLLRWDDTNPEKEQQEFVDAIRTGLEWLGIKFDGESYVSDDVPKLYAYCGQMLKNGDAYACTCSQEEMAKNREEKKECGCRKRSHSENEKVWKGMLDGAVKRGEATVRLKADMACLNTVMRDPVLFRIIEATHYRQGDKYRVWPNYDFEVAIEDSITGVTHAMRSKEYELRNELYFTILDKLKLRKPQLIEFSRLSIKNAPVSKRLLKPLIDEGKVMGWDDPRLPTLMGLKRRGILPEAIREFVLGFGLSKVESNPPYDKLLAINKKMLEDKAPHMFFVARPVKVEVVNANDGAVELRKHPSVEMGTRKIAVAKEFYVSEADADKLREKTCFRLKDLYNVQVTGKKEDGTIVGEFCGAAGKHELVVQWVSAMETEHLHAKILVPKDLLNDDETFNEGSLEVMHGYAEITAQELAQGDRVQFERIGFCILDDKATNTYILSC